MLCPPLTPLNDAQSSRIYLTLTGAPSRVAGSFFGQSWPNPAAIARRRTAAVRQPDTSSR